jgi:hypothetical protein
MLSGTRSTLLTFLLLAGWATMHPAAAQDTAADTGAEATEARDTTAPRPDEPQATGSACVATPPGSPLEYEASEQISEDLSVSFPVDI